MKQFKVKPNASSQVSKDTYRLELVILAGLGIDSDIEIGEDLHDGCLYLNCSKAHSCGRKKL